MSKQLIQQYYAQVEKLIQYGGSRNESVLRKAFQELLDHYARSKNLLLVPEVEYVTKRGHKVYPDGTLKDALRQDWGYWESKDEKDDLAEEIAVKIGKGYPTYNILFEDTVTAVLYQGGVEVMRADFSEDYALDEILTLFVSYEPPEVRAFHKAIQQFSADVPMLAQTLREIIEEQYSVNETFKKALGEFLELCKKSVNPKVEMADMREMIIQHVLTEDIFMRVFDDADFHRENVIAQKLQEVAGTFYHGDTKRNIHARIAPYYETINARASQISDHHEKQKFLKALYENFYKAYNPKAADRLGVIYTPDEIVHFMIESCDFLVFRHFGKTLGYKDVDILDPATGTGTFITELIEYLPSGQLDFKYEHEIHCNEVAILPYYIANLNIEFTYKQKTGKYREFEHICFVDTLDNMGFQHTGPQMNFFGITDENAQRITEQNTRKISVVIGNPPYNANQLNENENNKNRLYPDIDKRIKDTYIKQSKAQKTKLYDMYARFLRWASDRLDKNGVVAFVSNNSFLNAKSFDGFRRVIAKEFNEIYIVDLKGDARTSGERRRKEGGNIFSDQIRVGIAIYFLVRKQGVKGCHIYYKDIADYARAEDKLAYLRENKFTDVKFQYIRPDKNHNWLNISESDWEAYIPLISNETTYKKSVFDVVSLGVSTNRDEWVYDFSQNNLEKKVRFFVEKYNSQVDNLKKQNVINVDDLVDYSIKWSEALKRNLIQGKKLKYDSDLIINLGYRPFIDVLFYSEKLLSDRLTRNHYEIFGSNLVKQNKAIVINVSNRPFNVLATNHLTDLHFNGDAKLFPIFRYSDNDRPVENITDWALEQFRKHYKDRGICKVDIFNYVYGILHKPAYRVKYEQNLKREFPRIPFYEDFWKWEGFGKQLINLHLNYEQVEPYPLEVHTRKVEEGFRVTPRLISHKDRGTIEVDTVTYISGVPPEAWKYRLGTYTALEWILDRYKEKKPKDPTIAEKFNTYKFVYYKEKVIDLLLRVCTVSIETMKIIARMPGDK
jgi:predicted helicase